jgi:ferredoxin
VKRERGGCVRACVLLFLSRFRAFAFARFSLARSGASRARMKNNLERETLLFFLFRFASLRALTILCSSLLLINVSCSSRPLDERKGACEGSLACSTCHVIVEDQAVFDKLPEACDDENDMLDLAFGLTETSRLGCQIIAKEDIDGIRVKIPAATRNFAVDGFVPKPH